MGIDRELGPNTVELLKRVCNIVISAHNSGKMKREEELVALMWNYYKPMGFTGTAIMFIKQFTKREWTREELDALIKEEENDKDVRTEG